MMAPEKIDHKVGKVTSYLGVFLTGWLSCSAYYGTLHLTQVESVDLPKATSAAACEDRRADKATVVAKQAIESANSNALPIPSRKAIPKDNCPHPTVPPAATD